MRRRPPRSTTTAIVVAILLLSTAACGSGSGVEPHDGGASSSSAPCQGPRSAESEGWVSPVEATPQLPVTVTDFSGEAVTITDASRILALDTYGTLGTTVYALGLGRRLVGRDISTGVPALADLPVVTHNGHELNAEAILELNPSVILTDYSIGPLEVQLQLKDSGIPVVILDGARNRSVIGEQLRAVAAALGVSQAGDRLATQVDNEVTEAEAYVTGLRHGQDPLRMVFLYMRGNAGVYYWFGKGSGADDLIDALGGVDVATESGLAGSRPLNAEGLVKAGPELYLMMTDGLKSVGGVDGLLEVPGVGDTTAGVNACIVTMADTEVLSFGPQFPSTLRALGKAIYSDGSGTNR